MNELNLDQIQTEHRRWLAAKDTSAGQRTDSATILALTAELRKARDDLANTEMLLDGARVERDEAREEMQAAQATAKLNRISAEEWRQHAATGVAVREKELAELTTLRAENAALAEALKRAKRLQGDQE